MGISRPIGCCYIQQYFKIQIGEDEDVGVVYFQYLKSNSIGERLGFSFSPKIPTVSWNNLRGMIGFLCAGLDTVIGRISFTSSAFPGTAPRSAPASHGLQYSSMHSLVISTYLFPRSKSPKIVPTSRWATSRRHPEAEVNTYS